jgi:hypothetical protein
VSAQKRAPPAPHVASVAAQVVVHIPAEHTSPAAHLRPHAPQWSRSVSAITHTSTPAPASAPPSADAPPARQATCPLGQTTRHTPAAQRAPAPHATPHAPQWRASVCGSTHAPPHSVCEPVHVGAMSVTASTPLSVAPPTTARSSQPAAVRAAATSAAPQLCFQ